MDLKNSIVTESNHKIVESGNHPFWSCAAAT